MLSFCFTLTQIINITVEQLPADNILTFRCYARTLASKLDPDLKANLNGHPSICHSIQI